MARRSEPVAFGFLVVNPNCTSSTTDKIAKAARKAVPVGVEVVAVTKQGRKTHHFYASFTANTENPPRAITRERCTAEPGIIYGAPAMNDLIYLVLGLSGFALAALAIRGIERM